MNFHAVLAIGLVQTLKHLSVYTICSVVTCRLLQLLFWYQWCSQYGTN